MPRSTNVTHKKSGTPAAAVLSAISTRGREGVSQGRQYQQPPITLRTLPAPDVSVQPAVRLSAVWLRAAVLSVVPVLQLASRTLSRIRIAVGGYIVNSPLYVPNTFLYEPYTAYSNYPDYYGYSQPYYGYATDRRGGFNWKSMLMRTLIGFVLGNQNNDYYGMQPYDPYYGYAPAGYSRYGYDSTADIIPASYSQDRLRLSRIMTTRVIRNRW